MTSSAAHANLRQGLVVAEIALACTLLMCAGLLLRSLSHMRLSDFGFDGTNVTTALIPYRSHRFANADEFLNFVGEVQSRVGALPGVQSVAVTNARPTEGPGVGTFVQVVGRRLLPRSQQPVVGFEIVSPSYFEMMGIRVLRGRALSELDERNGPRVALINDTMARAMFNGEDALGQRLLMDDSPFGDITTKADGMYEIVGVVADERVSRFADTRPKPLVYVSLNQKPDDDAGVLIVRTANPQPQIGELLQRAVAQIDPTQALTGVETVDALKADLTSTDKFRSTLISIFASVALLLAAVGIYGVMSYAVGQRKREIGIRSALGATPARLVRLVLSSALRLALVGLMMGSAAGFGAAHLLRGYLFGVSTTDPVTLVEAVLTLAVAAAAASDVPARRAAAANPLDVLRSE